MQPKSSKTQGNYAKLSGEEEVFLQHKNESDSTLFLVEPSNKSLRLRLYFSVAFNIITVVSLIGIGISQYLEHSVLNKDLRRCSSYSPIHNLLDLEPNIKKVNGSLFPSKTPSISRELPNPKADSLWDEWELTRVFPLTRQDIIKMGKDPSYTAKLEDKIWGLGDDAYAGTFDVYHQLHCLNSLRHIAYGSYYNVSMANPERLKMPEIHLNHCVDILMQALQCSGNVNIMTMDWVATQTYPFPDMSVNRHCINFEKLTAWRKANTIDMDKYVKVMEKPEGVVERPMADQFYAYHGWESPNHKNGANPGEDFNV